MRYRNIAVHEQGAVAYIALNRPEQSNRISVDLLGDLSRAFAAFADRDDLRAIVLFSAGDHFCAGWEAEVLSGEIAGLAGAFDAVAALPQPLVVALHGDVTSAGLELALAGDVRIAAEGARFALPESQFGLLPLAGGAARLPWLVGRGAAIDLMLTGRAVETAEALRIGLVNRVVPPTRLIEEATAVAEQIAERGPIAVRLAKEALCRGLDMTLDQALRYETDLTVLLQTTEDRAEGVRAFIEKRPPTFHGR